jgi:hypothetical protein
MWAPIVLCILALFGLQLGLALRIDGDDADAREDARLQSLIQWFQAARTNGAQVEIGCAALTPYAYGLSASRRELAFTAMAEAAMHMVENGDKALANFCLEPLRSLLDSNRHPPARNPWVLNTRGLEATIALWRRFPDDKELREDTSFLIGGGYGVDPQQTRKVRELGGYEVLLDTLAHFPDDPDLQMEILRALSDPSYTQAGADAIANAHGPLKGCELLMDHMRSHPQPHLAESPTDHLALLYEVMQVSAGILWSGNQSYAQAFVEAGLLDQILYAMTVEPDLRGTNDVACKCMHKLAEQIPSQTVTPLIQGGAVTLITDAMTTFHDYDPTPFCEGHTLGNEYPVIPFCVQALKNFQRAEHNATRKAMREAGTPEVLMNIRPGLRGENHTENLYGPVPSIFELIH